MSMRVWGLAVALVAMQLAEAFQLTGYSACRPLLPAASCSFLRSRALCAGLSPSTGRGRIQNQGNVRTTLRMAGAVEAVDAETFEVIIQEETKPLVVDFYAEWCGPCRLVAPQLEEVAQTMKDQVRFLKINTDENERLATLMQVYALPTLLLIKDGAVVQRAEGAMMANQIRDLVKTSFF
ncbi:thioredoxin y [Guillardia theta CCMP2712]|uniref:Thioredoxin y n=2 Tax=Guillardia theta TaxID=55529 RepID=L1JSE6_GUITC|nr:thioredoxin y [Guillardia theta CCMP2712]EKX51357.1 thioredoxin y [Guillardia theta CCMP2712]|eukprot:XP_005838337.1 thioredoxin y [Guillardia theta CCMP2712]